MEKLGRGSAMIRKACQERNLPEPKWRSDSTGVTLTFFTPEVTPEVKRVIKCILGEMSRQEIKNLLRLKDDEHFRKSYLNPALSSGMIEMTISEKPRSSKQKYRITDLGKKVVKKIESS